MNTLSEILREKMYKENLTYDSLSKKLGISKTYLTSIIKHGKVPTGDTIKDISNKLKAEGII